MGTIAKGAMAAAAFAVSLAAPTSASANATIHTAEKLRKLDIMLMVSSLRCRYGSDNFQPEYRQFSAKHIGTLNHAAKTLQSDLTRQHGHKGAKRRLDKISVGMANRYGLGHPWLGCGELKQVATDLANVGNRHELIAAADELLAERKPGNSVMLAHYAPSK